MTPLRVLVVDVMAQPVPLTSSPEHQRALDALGLRSVLHVPLQGRAGVMGGCRCSPRRLARWGRWTWRWRRSWRAARATWAVFRWMTEGLEFQRTG